MNVPPQFNQCLGDAVRANRKQAGLNQSALAEKAGVTRRFIQELENGRSDISLQTLYRLSRAMGASLDSLTVQIEALLAGERGKS